MHRCIKCQEKYDDREKNFYKTGKGYYSNVCRRCKIEYNRKRRLDENVKKKELVAARKKYTKNNEKRRKKRKENEIYAKEDRERSKKFRQNNKQYFRNYFKKYRKKNKLYINMRRRFHKWLKKPAPEKLFGCDQHEFKKHIEQQFDEKMNWENYGKYWSIDHIFPISKAQTEEDLIAVFHYSNSRPISISDNSRKNNNICFKSLTMLMNDQNTPTKLKDLVRMEINSHI